ncbi:MAG: RICIN domain-containing protein [Armatimonadota bacterium]|nr:RICIN domain-containing protein [Armatimonadota bacterium]
MNHQRLLFGLLAALLLPLALPARADTTATVDPSIQYGTWEGWGTSLAWWAKVIGGFPEPTRSDYMDKAFDPVKGLGLNVVRYNIGGGENPAHQSFMSFRAAVPGYQSAPGVWDWTADANQRYVLQAAIKKGANQLEAFSNSPPWWMTKSGSVTGNQGGADNLKPDQDAAFAEYLAGVVKHFHDQWGITFRDVEPLNEPSGTWWTFGGASHGQEGCHVDRPHQNDVVKATGAALARQGINYLTVTASDEPSIGDADKTFGAYDGAARRFLSKLNAHTYGGGDRTQLSDFANSIGSDLWMSEYGDGDASGMQLSREILTDVKGLHPSSWVYWQVVDGGGWGMLTNALDAESHTDYGINEKYYVMGQYSRFIRPGDSILAVDDLHTLAAFDPRAKTVILVTTNDGDAPANIAFDLSQFARLGTTASATRTSATEKWTALPAAPLMGKRLAVTLPPKSVTSYVISGAAYTGPMGFHYRDYYSLVNKGSGLPLGVANGAVSLGTATNGPEQQWGLVGVGNGAYYIINRASGLVLDVNNARTTPGADILQYAFGGGKNQLWRPVRAANGDYTLLNLNSGLPLTPSGSAAGAGLIQQTADNSPAQQWQLRKVAR